MASNLQEMAPVLAIEGDLLVLRWQDERDLPLDVPLTKWDDPRLFETTEFWKVGFVGTQDDFNSQFPLYRWDEEDDLHGQEFIVVLMTQHQIHTVEEGHPDDRLVLEPIRLEFVVTPSSPPKKYFDRSEFEVEPYWAFPEGRKPTIAEAWWTRLRRRFCF